MCDLSVEEMKFMKQQMNQFHMYEVINIANNIKKESQKHKYFANEFERNLMKRHYDQMQFCEQYNNLKSIR